MTFIPPLFPYYSRWDIWLSIQHMVHSHDVNVRVRDLNTCTLHTVYSTVTCIGTSTCGTLVPTQATDSCISQYTVYNFYYTHFGKQLKEAETVY